MRDIGPRHPLLDGVISSFSLKSSRLVRVSLVEATRSECIHRGLTSAIFECDDGPVAVLSELHAAVLYRSETCPHCWTVNLADVKRRVDTEK